MLRIVVRKESMISPSYVVDFDLNGKRMQGTLVKKNSLTVWVQVSYSYKRKYSKGTTRSTIALKGSELRMPVTIHNGYYLKDFIGTKIIKRHIVKHNVKGI
jgi:hypothetical protein